MAGIKLYNVVSATLLFSLKIFLFLLNKDEIYSLKFTVTNYIVQFEPNRIVRQYWLFISALTRKNLWGN